MTLDFWHGQSLWVNRLIEGAFKPRRAALSSVIYYSRGIAVSRDALRAACASPHARGIGNRLDITPQILHSSD
jgi:hypothetical protein